MLLCAAKKSTSGAVELVEGEHDVINLGKVEGYMAAALQSLKHEYTTSVTARITPGTAGHMACGVTPPQQASVACTSVL